MFVDLTTYLVDFERLGQMGCMYGFPIKKGDVPYSGTSPYYIES